MDEKPALPTSLKIVAGLYIFTGLSMLVDIVLTLLRGHVPYNFLIFTLPIGIGLLRLNRFARIGAFVLMWLAIVVLLIAIGEVLTFKGMPSVMLFGQEIGHIPKAYVLSILASGFILTIWMHYALMRPAVRALFRLQKPAAA